MTTESKATPLGPNVKKLIILKISVDAIPAGGGFADGVKFLTTKGAMAAGWSKAAEWVRAAIQAVRDAADPNPWKTADDEVIAAEIVRQMESKQHA